MSSRDSFYGGPNGQSFQIKWIFSNKRDMESDIVNKGWTSSISVGEYVLISYGLPSDTDYEKNRDIDLNGTDAKSFQSTLWQKVYIDDTTSSAAGASSLATELFAPSTRSVTGLAYKFIASLTGFTPRMDIDFTVLDAGEQPVADWDNTNVDNPVLVISIPQSQVIYAHNVITEHPDAGTDVSVNWDNTDVNAPVVTFYIPKSQVLQQGTTTLEASNQMPSFSIDSSDINRPVLNFKLPKAQVIKDFIKQRTGVDGEPAIEYLTSGSAVILHDGTSFVPTITNPVIRVTLPDSQEITSDNVIFHELDADEDPYVEFITTTKTIKGVTYVGTKEKPVLLIEIPQAQVLVQGSITAVDADQNPAFDIDSSDINRPVLSFELPQAQVLQEGITTVINADQEPSFEIDSSNINRPVLNFELPQAQVLQQGAITPVNADQDPSFDIDNTNINRPVLSFEIPKSQVLQEGTTTVIDADQDPSFEIDNSDINRPVLNFELPQAQVMRQPGYATVGPGVNPSVTLDDTQINAPKLDFNLPRAAKYFYGSLLNDNNPDNRAILNSELPTDLEIGDYYVNEATGFIWVAIAKDNSETTFNYEACIQAPLPRVAASVETTYVTDEEGNLVLNEPTVERILTNDPEHPWQLSFTFPGLPAIVVDVEYIGSKEEGSADVNPIDEETIKFDFSIPQGTKIFTGDLITARNFNVHIDGSNIGDLYINSDTGEVFEYAGSDVWTRAHGSLKGPVGDSLNIVRRYTFQETDTITNDDNTTFALIEAEYAVDPEYSQLDPPKLYPDPDEIVAVKWLNQEGEDSSYWCFYTANNVWGRALLTGSVLNFIANEYVDTTDNPVVDRTYSISYINELIGGNIETNFDKKAFSKDQIFALLSWGKISDGVPDIDDLIPEPLTHETLSVDEVVELMSWSSLSKLLID